MRALKLTPLEYFKRMRWICTECNKELKSRIGLKIHCTRVHTGPRDRELKMKTAMESVGLIFSKDYYECNDYIKKSIGSAFLIARTFLQRKQRKDELVMALKSVGLELRNDSKLCSQYIYDSHSLELEYVVKRMCQIKYLFEYKNIRPVLDRLAKERKILWRKDRHDTRFLETLMEEAEQEVMIGQSYPAKYPWMQDDMHCI